MQSLVSVVVPIYNTELYLEQCIDSVLQQNFKDFELVLVDDGSTDNSGKICDRYALTDNRVKVIHKPNGGLVDACRVGIENSTGKYLLFVDSDDWIDTDMLEKLCSAAEKHSADIVLCHLIREEENKGIKREMHRLPTGVYDREKIKRDIFPQLISDGTFEGKIVAADTRAARLFKRDLIVNNLVYYRKDICYGEDLVLAFASICDANVIYAFDDYYPYHYRKVNTSMTQAYIDNMWHKMLMLHNQIKLISQSKGVYDFGLQMGYELTKYSVLTINHLFRHSNMDSKQRLETIREIANEPQLRAYLKELDYGKYEGNRKIMTVLLKLKLPRVIYLLKTFQVKYVLKD